MGTMTITKEAALAAYVECDADEVTESHADALGTVYEAPGQDWYVLTDDEADSAVVESIRESLWAFNASFLADETGLPQEVFEALQPRCEDANEAILRIVEQGDGLEAFASAAVSADGRGHFLAGYDFNEIELDGGFFAYRIN